jgi:APA family basic amino acid/polyamine antiporter
VKTQLFYCKSTQELIQATLEPHQQMKRSLGALELIGLGIGATIGSGIFALTGTAASGQALNDQSWLTTPLINYLLGWSLGREGAGPAVVVSFLVAAVACGFAALCYAELASMIPVAGSAYTFAYASLGQVVAWIIGWDLILEYAIGNVAVAISWSDYFLRFVGSAFSLRLPLWLTTDTNTALVRLAAPDNNHHPLYSNLALPHLFGHSLALNLPAFFIVALITVLLVLGARESAIFNSIVVAIKLAVVIFFLGFGIGFVKVSNWVPFAPNGWGGIMGGAAIVFFSFIGFDAISSISEETKNPQRDLPIGMLGTLIICTGLYAAVSLVLTGILPYKNYVNDAAPVATALAAIGQPWAQALVSAGALAGMTSVLLVFQLGQPRIFMAMARDRLLPAFFARLHPQYKTPFLPTILTGLFVGVSALLIDIGQAAELTNIGTLSAFIIVCAGVIVLRKRDPAHKRSFHCPLVPVIPLLGIFSCFILMLSLPVITWFRFFAWMALGMFIYWFYAAPNAAKPLHVERSERTNDSI